MKTKSVLHPGFQKVAAMIARKSGMPAKDASAVLASSSRNASPQAKKKNSRLGKVLSILFVLFSARSLQAQTSPQFNVTQYRASFAVETITVSSSNKTLTSATYNPTVTSTPSIQTRADYALITVENDCLRYWPNGTSPSTTVGHKVCDGGFFYVWGFDNLKNLNMIRITTDVTIQVSYYRFASNTP